MSWPRLIAIGSTLFAGQFLPAEDLENARAFVVLGSKLKEELFGGANPLGAAGPAGITRAALTP